MEHEARPALPGPAGPRRAERLRAGADVTEISHILDRILASAREAQATATAQPRDRSGLRAKLEPLGLPEKVLDFIVKGVDRHGLPWRDTEAASKLREALAGEKRLIILSGATGTGKSEAACRALVKSCRRDRSVTYRDREGVEHSETLGAIYLPGRYLRAVDYCRIADWQEDRLQQVWAAPFLVLDDLGEEAEIGPAAAGKVRAMLTKRDDVSAVTVITCNLSLKQLSETYHARVMDRLREIGAYLQISERVRPGGEK